MGSQRAGHNWATNTFRNFLISQNHHHYYPCKTVDCAKHNPKSYFGLSKILFWIVSHVKQLSVLILNIYTYIHIYQRRQWHPTPVLLPGKSHGWRSLVACSPWGRKQSDMTEQLHFHFSLSCIGEGNGNPLQCYCLKNSRDGGAWWAAISGVAQSRMQWSDLAAAAYTFMYALLFCITCSDFTNREIQ